MNKETIKIEINKYKSLLNSANVKLLDLKRDLETTNEFMNKFQVEAARFQDDITLRKRKMADVSSLARNVKSARKYYDYMDNMFNSSEHRQAFRNIESMENDIRRKITEINNNIYAKQREIRTYEQKISELNIKLVNCTE